MSSAEETFRLQRSAQGPLLADFRSGRSLSCLIKGVFLSQTQVAEAHRAALQEMQTAESNFHNCHEHLEAMHTMFFMFITYPVWYLYNLVF